MQFLGQISSQKAGHINLLEKIDAFRTYFWGQILGKTQGHTNLLEQTGGVQKQFWDQDRITNGAH